MIEFNSATCLFSCEITRALFTFEPKQYWVDLFDIYEEKQNVLFLFHYKSVIMKLLKKMF